MSRLGLLGFCGEERRGRSRNMAELVGQLCKLQRRFHRRSSEGAAQYKKAG